VEGIREKLYGFPYDMPNGKADTGSVSARAKKFSMVFKERVEEEAKE